MKMRENKFAARAVQQPLRHYHMARHSMLLVIAFTAINIVMLLSGSFTYFLFSATIPYFIVDMGMLLAGKYPAEMYPEGWELPALGGGFLAVMVVLAFLVIALYFLCWLLSKKQRVAFLIGALVLFTVDTIALFVLYGIDATMLVDYIFHALFLFELGRGVYDYFKYKEQAGAPVQPSAFSEQTEQTEQNEF